MPGTEVALVPLVVPGWGWGEPGLPSHRDPPKSPDPGAGCTQMMVGNGRAIRKGQSQVRPSGE